MHSQVDNQKIPMKSYDSVSSAIYMVRLHHRKPYSLPEEFNPHNTAVLEHYQIFATAYLVAEEIPETLLAKLKAYMKGIPKICGGCSKSDSNVLVIKVLMETSLGMQNILWNIWNMVRKEMYRKEAFRIRKY